MPFPDYVQSLNPIAYWRFEDSSSSSGATLENSSAAGAAYDGTYGTGVTLVSGPSLPYLSGQAGSFSGSGSSASAPNTSFPTGDSARTFITWLRTTRPSANDYPGLFSYGSEAPPLYRGFDVVLWSNGDANGNPFVAGEIGAGQYGDGITTQRAVNDGQWHFLAVTVDPLGAGATSGNPLWSIYLDGQYEYSKLMATSTVLDPVSAAIGMMRNNGTLWQGEIDEVAMFGRALTHAEIISLYRPSASVCGARADRPHTARRRRDRAAGARPPAAPGAIAPGWPAAGTYAAG